MVSDEKEGITVKIDAALHAEVRQYLENHGMTMAEFITMDIDDECRVVCSLSDYVKTRAV